MKRTAIVIGATGLVGSNLVKLLLMDEQYEKIIVFVRNSTKLQHAKLEEYIIDFDKPDEWKDKVKGDVLFSALGTTIKKAGSKNIQYKIDVTYQFNFAKAAAENKVGKYVLISSIGAKSSSIIFYTRMKGELEDKVKKLLFEKIIIMQPGLLHGEREEKRIMEELSLKILSKLNNVGILKNRRPIHGNEVAKSMIQAVKQVDKGLMIYSGEELFPLANSYDEQISILTD